MSSREHGFSPRITGETVEKELFGRSHYESKTGEHNPDYSFVRPERAFEMLKHMQPFNPFEPTPDFASELQASVYDRLGLDASQVGFFTAIKSPLDRFHGVDGWLEINQPGRQSRVTIDITTNPDKERSGADIIFLVPGQGLDRSSDRAEFDRHTAALAALVTDRLTH
jgi:hypothetical protein